MLSGGLKGIKGLNFEPAIFYTFGGFSEDTKALLLYYAERVAGFQGCSAKSVFNRVYGRLSHCI